MTNDLLYICLWDKKLLIATIYTKLQMLRSVPPLFNPYLYLLNKVKLEEFKVDWAG